MTRRLLLSALTVMALSIGSSAVSAPPIPETPAFVDGLVFAREFRVEQPYEHVWSADRPTVTEGWIVVIDIDPDLVYPRQVAEPVLYAGDRTAERISRGYPAGRLIALIPGPVDLAQTPIWFGSPELPERVDLQRARAERSEAVAAGIRAFDASTIRSALDERTLVVRGREDLVVELAALYQDLVAPLIPDESRYAPRGQQD